MRTLNRLRLSAGTLALLLVTLAYSADSAELPPPHQLIQEATGQVVDLIRSSDTDASSGQQIDRLLGILEPAVAFDPIARAVIGKHAAALDEEQTRQFIATFKRTMTRLYLDSMVAFGIDQVNVLPPASPLEANAERAKVEVEVLDQNGNRYRLEYFLGLNGDGNWKVRNIIVDGVNLGRTYRNQFDSAMSTYNHDPERVIRSWNQLVDE